MRPTRPWLAVAALLWGTLADLIAAPAAVSESAMLHFISQPPSVKELAFRWDGKKGNFQGALHGVLACHSNGCFFARYAGERSEFSNSFVFPKTEMYAQTETSYWYFGSPFPATRDDSLKEWVIQSGGGGPAAMGISNSVAFGSTEAFYSFCYGLPRLTDVSIDEPSGTFSGTPWTSLWGYRITGRVTVSRDHRSAVVDYLASYKGFTNYFSVQCTFPAPLTAGLPIPSEIMIRRAAQEGAPKELVTVIQIERVVPGTPDVLDFRSTAHYLLGMGHHEIVDTGCKTLPIKVDPQVEAAFAALPKGSPAQQLLSSAQAKAAPGHKVVFVHFGASWCGPCKRLDAFLEKAEVKAVFEKYFVPLKLVLNEPVPTKALENPGAAQLYKELGGGAGIPFCAFVDSRGALIANSRTAEGGTIGFPIDARGSEEFLQILRKAAPRMSAGELETIKAALTNSKGP